MRARTVLVVRGGALGDFVLTVPTLQALRRRSDRLLLACQPRYAALWSDLADSTIDLDRASWLFGSGEPPEPIAAAVAWSSGGAEALRALGVPEIRSGTPRPQPGVHASDHLWISAGLTGASPAPVVAPIPTALERVERLLGSRAPVALAPGAGADDKQWHGFAEVARRLAQRGVPVVWVPGLDEGLAGTAIARDVLPVLALPDVVALAARCGAWIGNDTGTTHLAAAAGAAVIALFGPTDPACWAPRAPPGGSVDVAGFDVDPETVAALAQQRRSSAPR